MDDSPSSHAGNVVVRTNAWYWGDRHACPGQTRPWRPFLALPRVSRQALCQPSAPETDVKVAFRLVPRPCTTAMIATEMPAAIKPYSMAVAPDLSFKNLAIAVLLYPRLGDVAACGSTCDL